MVHVSVVSARALATAAQLACARRRSPPPPSTAGPEHAAAAGQHRARCRLADEMRVAAKSPSAGAAQRAGPGAPRACHQGGAGGRVERERLNGLEGRDGGAASLTGAAVAERREQEREEPEPARHLPGHHGDERESRPGSPFK